MIRRHSAWLAALGMACALALGSALLRQPAPARVLAGSGDRDADGRLHDAAVALEQIALELSMGFVSLHVPTGGETRVQTGFVATATAEGGSRIDFTSFGHQRTSDGARESDQHELGFYLQDGALTRRRQAVLDQDPGAGGVERVLLGDVKDFRLEFLDGDSLLWLDRWDASEGAAQAARLPLQVKISLTLADPGGGAGALTLGTRARIPLQHALNHAVYR